jgi:hypothetical protein
VSLKKEVIPNEYRLRAVEGWAGGELAAIEEFYHGDADKADKTNTSGEQRTKTNLNLGTEN